MSENARATLSRFVSAYGMLAVLVLLCVYFSWATYHEESATGPEAAQGVARVIVASGKRPSVVVVAPASDAGFGQDLAAALKQQGIPVVGTLQGGPPEVREGLEALSKSGRRIDMVAAPESCASWTVFDALRKQVSSLANLEVVTPTTQGRSAFLSPSNLRNVADQIAVIALMAVGMTLVIVTAGIDLSVGSLLALSAVVTAWFIHAWGGTSASTGAMLAASLIAIAMSGLVGGFSGLMITTFDIPPFIATLAMMQVASGLAFLVARGQSIYDLPDSFTWLGRGTGVAALPNAALLMVAVYIVAHLVMMRTTFGRHIYAVGGGPEAARLSGLRTKRLLMQVYLLSGVMAGVGGVVTASQLKAGAPTYGQSYELYVIAAVVVGGTSLSGGEGRILGTLIGAFTIAVIRNGMNLMNVEPYTQKVVLGLVILAAVLLDRMKRRWWR
ncbi:MAG TPA: ABC transporter permease [Armatimonadota bacterium]|jgi:ribose transport system permease protein